MDAIDAAAVELTPDGTLRHTVCADRFPLPESLAGRLRGVGPASSLEEVAELDAVLGDRFAEAASRLMERCPQPPVAIGSHGQTVWHAPDRRPAATVQIGDPNRIAARTRTDTVADFRRRDLAEGGQGAPLAPVFHHGCLGSADEDRAVLNLGGIANLSLLPSGGAPWGFDTGPANVLLDRWHRRWRGGPCDQDGLWAAGGTVRPELLQRLLQHPYFAASAPKSTGPEAFHLDWLDPLVPNGVDPQDVQATLAELTAQTVADGLYASGLKGPARLLVCGGGVHNADLMERLRRCLAPLPVLGTDTEGIDPDYVEAIGFAWLAWARMHDLPTGVPRVTGAREASCLGAIYRGAPGAG